VNGGAVLRNLNLSVEPGEFLLVLGPNGAGKTTLLKLIDGLLRPSSGRIEILGTTLGRRLSKGITRRVAYVPQSQEVDPRIPISVRDVVAIGRLSHKSPLARMGGGDRRIVRDSMDSLSLLALADRPFGHLSAGQRQKVSLARALAQQAPVMLLDEPMNNLDPVAQADLRREVERIHRSTGKTIVMVTHLLESIPDTVNRALLLRDGTMSETVSLERLGDEAFRRELYATLGGNPGGRRTAA
jgi:ABC-type Mn2+/Zn2+ transport system ATPase subunit